MDYMVGPQKRDGSYDLSKPISQREAYEHLRQWLDHRERDFMMKRRGDPWGRVRNGHDAWSRLHDILPNLSVGDTLIIKNSRSEESWAIRVVDVAWKPMNTTGTDAIDKIAGATYDEFDSKFGLVNLGICADKPGQHNRCNAFDFGVQKPNSDDEIHRAIREVAAWQKAHAEDIPILGIIVMYEWCEWTGSGMTNWNPYHGEPHVTHVHTSGRPSMYAGWI